MSVSSCNLKTPRFLVVNYAVIGFVQKGADYSVEADECWTIKPVFMNLQLASSQVRKRLDLRSTTTRSGGHVADT